MASTAVPSGRALAIWTLRGGHLTLPTYGVIGSWGLHVENIVSVGSHCALSLVLREVNFWNPTGQHTQ